MSPTTLLHAALQDLFAGTNCPGQYVAFLYAVGYRFLKEDVFARFQSADRHGDVPVVRGGDDHCIDVFFEDFTIIQVGGCETVGSFLDGITVGCIQIVTSDNLIRADLVSGIEKTFHAVTGPDDSETNRVIGAEYSG